MTMINKWQKTLRLADQCSQQEHLFSAIYHYKNAKRMALSLFNQWSEPEQAINAMLISYEDLARFYIRKNQGTLAQKELREAHEIMLRSLHLKGYDHTHRYTLLRGVNQSYSNLLRHLRIQKESRFSRKIQLNRLLFNHNLPNLPSSA